MWLLFANTSLESPRIGYVRLANQEVWSLRGIAGSFYFGERTAATVDHHTFNGSIGIRTAGENAEFLGSNGEVLRIVRLDGEVRLLGLSAIEDTAYVLTSTELWRIGSAAADRFSIPELEAGQRLAGITGAGGYVEIAIVADAQVTTRRIWLETGESTAHRNFSGDASHLIFLPHNMLLWSAGSTLNLRRADGSTVEIDTGGEIGELTAMAERMAHATAIGGRQYVLRILGDPLIPQSIEVRLLPLPESAN